MLSPVLKHLWTYCNFFFLSFLWKFLSLYPKFRIQCKNCSWQFYQQIFKTPARNTGNTLQKISVIEYFSHIPPYTQLPNITYHHVHSSLGLHRSQSRYFADPVVEVSGIFLHILYSFIKEMLWGGRQYLWESSLDDRIRTQETLGQSDQTCSHLISYRLQLFKTPSPKHQHKLLFKNDQSMHIFTQSKL